MNEDDYILEYYKHSLRKQVEDMLKNNEIFDTKVYDNALMRCVRYSKSDIQHTVFSDDVRAISGYVLNKLDTYVSKSKRLEYNVSYDSFALDFKRYLYSSQDKDVYLCYNGY